MLVYAPPPPLRKHRPCTSTATLVPPLAGGGGIQVAAPDAVGEGSKALQSTPVSCISNFLHQRPDCRQQSIWTSLTRPCRMSRTCGAGFPHECGRAVGARPEGLWCRWGTGATCGAAEQRSPQLRLRLMDSDDVRFVWACGNAAT